MFYRLFVLQLMTAKNTYLSCKSKVLFLPTTVHLHQWIKVPSLSIFMLCKNIGSRSLLFLKMVTLDPNPSGAGSGASSVQGHYRNQQNVPTVYSLESLILTPLKFPCKFLPPLTSFLFTFGFWHIHKENSFPPSARIFWS